jgi:hypothetical protein
VSGDRRDHLVGQGSPVRVRRTSLDPGICQGHTSSAVPLDRSRAGVGAPASAFSEDALGGKARLDRWFCVVRVAGRVR